MRVDVTIAYLLNAGEVKVDNTYSSPLASDFVDKRHRFL